MKVERVITGELKENCYVLVINDKVIVIDPGDDYHKISNVIGDREIVAILITHNHFDHVGALSYFNGIKVYDFDNLSEDEYNFGPFNFKVIFNPGHSFDSVSYYFYNDHLLFSGDFIFYESIGRCDLPSGNIHDMKKSIDKIRNYPNDMVIYPGHGNYTNLEHEINNNIYFKEIV